MHKVAIVVLSSPETHEGRARAVNAFQVARELKTSGDEVTIVFDGAGTVAAATLSDPSHRVYRLFATIEDRILGACSYCARAFEVKDQIEATDIRLLDDFNGHPSVRTLIEDGYQIITF